MPTLIFIRLYLKSFYQKTNFLTSYFYLHNPKHNLLDSSYSITNQIHVVYPSFFQFYHHFHIGMHIILLILVFHNFIFVYLLKYQIGLFINQSWSHYKLCPTLISIQLIIAFPPLALRSHMIT